MNIKILRENIVETLNRAECSLTCSELAKAILSDDSAQAVRTVSNALTSHAWFDKTGISRSRKGNAYGYSLRRY